MSILKAGRPSAGVRAMTMSDIASPEKVKRVNFDLPEALHTKLGSLQNSEFKVR